MRVVHIGHVPLPKDHPCGKNVSKFASHPGRWVLNLAKAQNEHVGIEAEITCKVPSASRDWTTSVEGVKCHFIAVPNILRGKTGFFLDCRILARFVRSLSPDIVHAHGTEEANALATLRTGLPRVLTVQGCFFIINRTLPPKFFSRQWIVERLERKSIPRFPHVITKSEYVQREIQTAFPTAHTHLIPNTYDPALEAIAIDQPRDNAVAYVGSIDPRKGVDLIVQAMKLLRDSEVRSQKSEARPLTSDLRSPTYGHLPTLHIFGNHGDGASEYEKEQISDLKAVLGERLILHGKIPQLEMARIVATCQALIAPSREEMFGNQVIEALLVGTHVIVTDGTAMAENVRKFGNGTIIPQNAPASLASALQSKLESAEGRIRMNEDAQKTESVAARDAIIASMSPKIIARAHEQLYRKAVEEYTFIKK